AMAEDDPRQAGLFAAAWTVGYAAAIATTEVATLAVNQLAGPQGVAAEDGRPHPVFHVMAALTGAGGRPRVPIEVDGRVAALGWQEGGERRLLVANQTAKPVTVSMPAGLRGKVLDTASFDAA